MADILAAPTPAAWVESAVERWRELLVDHANCEKKAASTAIALMFAYPEDQELSLALARLAREELRHFEQVRRLMIELAVPFERQAPGRYAARLRSLLHTGEPERKLDLLLAGALIEARSAERFRLLGGRLSEPLARLYLQLGAAEARHFELYLHFARRLRPDRWRARLTELAAVEAELASQPDTRFRFHSGPVP